MNAPIISRAVEHAAGSSGLTLFDTPIGRCGIAWTPRGIAAFQLPEARDTLTRQRLETRVPGAVPTEPPPSVREAIDAVLALLDGTPDDLCKIDLDWHSIPPFHRRVYELARSIGPGATLTYGELATRLGDRSLARAVGQALGRNPYAVIVPCHRVLASGGKLGGFSANGGITTKLKLLRIEGAMSIEPDLFDGDGRLGFDADAAVAHLRASDARLAALIDAVGPFRMQLKRTPSIFVALAEAIVYQQLTGRAAATIYARLCELFPRPQDGPTPEGLIRLSERSLRAAGLSGAKTRSLKDLAARTIAGEIPTITAAHAMADEDLIERLTQVRGIGRWTVEMLLMFRLNRADILPVDDYGIRKGFAAAFGLRSMPTRDQMLRRAERWRPHRTAASWYLWRAAERADAAR